MTAGCRSPLRPISRPASSPQARRRSPTFAISIPFLSVPGPPRRRTRPGASATAPGRGILTTVVANSAVHVGSTVQTAEGGSGVVMEIIFFFRCENIFF